MTKQIPQVANGTRGTPVTGKGASVQVRLQPDVLEAIDSWIDKQPEPTTRPHAIRLLTEIGLLTEKGKKPPTTLDEKVAAAKSTIADNQPSGKPSPKRGMDTLRRGLAENDLRTLKAEKSKTKRGVTPRR